MLAMRLWPSAVLAGFLASAPIAALGSDARDELAGAAQAFEQAVLRLQDSDDKPRGVVRWDGPIFYTARNAQASSTIEAMAFAAVGRIAEIAHLPVERVAPDDPRANTIVVLTDNESSSGLRTCFAQPSWKNWRMTKVELNLNFANIRRIDRCVVHEALHGFGFNSHPHSADSILSYVYNRSDLTLLDRHLIETFYDRRLRPGMPRTDAAKQACRILGEKMTASAADIEAVCPLRK
jgi:hypothetical protein